MHVERGLQNISVIATGLQMQPFEMAQRHFDLLTVCDPAILLRPHYIRINVGTVVHALFCALPLT
jgi:hypothetical protein